jgi:hypothetical protein
MTVKQAEQRKVAAGKALDELLVKERRTLRKWRGAALGSSERNELRSELRKVRAKRLKAEWKHADARRALKKAHANAVSLGEKAWAAAGTQLGVMESGGNNMGVPYERYQKPNGATGPEPWCGDFVAWCYRQAGSKSVARRWAAVRLILPGTGLKRVSASEARQGDIVRFSLPGQPLFHVGLFGKHLGNGMIATREGNTGSTIAGTGGGDGVSPKVRPTSMVHDYIRVTR